MPDSVAIPMTSVDTVRGIKMFGCRLSTGQVMIVIFLCWMVTTFRIVTRLEDINSDTHINIFRHEIANSLDNLKRSLDVQETHKRLEGKMIEMIGEVEKQANRFDEMAKQANRFDEIVKHVKMLGEIAEKMKRFEDIARQVEQIHEVDAKILEQANKRTAEIEDKVEKDLKRKTEDNWESFGEEEDDDDDVLIEVDIPELPDAVYDPQPDDAPGENGAGVSIDINTLTPDERQRLDYGNKVFGYNSFVSDRISLHRGLPDIKHQSCPREFDYDLPETSIILCFHNEAWSVLLRTVHSVLNTSPAHLIKEIILFDDFSDMPHLGKPLEYYMSRLKKVRIIRAKERVGSIRARTLAMSAAKATVLTVLDSHCECFPGWLEPLLERVATGEPLIVAPVINVIFKDTFAVDGTPLKELGGVHLETVEFKWLPLSDKRRNNHPEHEPYKSPTIAGGLFSMRKDYFYQIGTYDQQMEIWGPDNVELSLRVWMCGGSLEVHPCSHVSHIYRDSTPYSWDGDVSSILKKNHVRVAEVWLDDYKQFYYERIGYDLGDYGDVSERKQLRKDLKCQSFQWYIDNVFPEIVIPPKAVFIGEIQMRHAGATRCLDSMQFDAIGIPAEAIHCHGQLSAQLWKLTENEDIRVLDGCLDYEKSQVVMLPCSDKKSQKWNRQNQIIRHQETNLCLGVNSMDGADNLQLEVCASQPMQTWDFIPISKH